MELLPTSNETPKRMIRLAIAASNEDLDKAPQASAQQNRVLEKAVSASLTGNRAEISKNETANQILESVPALLSSKNEAVKKVMLAIEFCIDDILQICVKCILFSHTHCKNLSAFMVAQL
jgi:hypothetical protein